jgi:SAM-dependent methyltransferase
MYSRATTAVSHFLQRCVPPRAVRIGLVLAAAVLGGALAAQVVAPFVPTTAEDVERMLAIAAVGPGDYVIDLGSGDGRIVIAAARLGALAHGVEIDPDLVTRARRNAEAAGVADRVAFLHGDIFEADIGGATVVTLFLMPDANLRLRPMLLAELRPGTRVVSNSFDMGDWQPDRHVDARASGGILLWIVPARVAGNWQIEIDDAAVAPLALRIAQHYQRIELMLPAEAHPHTIGSAALHGERITFELQLDGRDYTFDGTVDAEGMHGFVQLRDGESTVVQRWTGVPD